MPPAMAPRATSGSRSRVAGYPLLSRDPGRERKAPPKPEPFARPTRGVVGLRRQLQHLGVLAGESTNESLLIRREWNVDWLRRFAMTHIDSGTVGLVTTGCIWTQVIG
jgi:hypothetical protein